jgi:hypothetical protein
MAPPDELGTLFLARPTSYKVTRRNERAAASHSIAPHPWRRRPEGASRWIVPGVEHEGMGP